MDDATWIKTVVERADTADKILAVIIDNEDFFGGDSYYADLRKAILKQAAFVLKEAKSKGIKI